MARSKRRGTAKGQSPGIFFCVSVVVVSPELINEPAVTPRTSGLGNDSKKKPAYDPARQWGLKPEDSSAGSTYVFSGHVVSGSASDSRSMYVGETIGREAQAKASRISAKDADNTLKALLERDKEGTRALLKARQAADPKDGIKDINLPSSKRVSVHIPSDSEEEEGSSRPDPPRKNAYSADVIKKLGFDPTSRAGKKNKQQVAELQRKVNDRFHLFLPFSRFFCVLISRSRPFYS